MIDVPLPRVSDLFDGILEGKAAELETEVESAEAEAEELSSAAITDTASAEAGAGLENLSPLARAVAPTLARVTGMDDYLAALRTSNSIPAPAAKTQAAQPPIG